MAAMVYGIHKGRCGDRWESCEYLLTTGNLVYLGSLCCGVVAINTFFRFIKRPL